MTYLRAFTRLDVIVLIVCAILIGYITVAQANQMRRVNKRAICAANLRGIVQAMFKYANSNDGCFPTVAPHSMGDMKIRRVIHCAMLTSP